MHATFANQGDLVEDKPLFANQGEVVEEPQFEPPHTPEVRWSPVGEITQLTPAELQSTAIAAQRIDPRFAAPRAPEPTIGRLIGQGMEWINRTFPAPPEPMPAPLTPIVAPPEVVETPEEVARRAIKERVVAVQSPRAAAIEQGAEKVLTTLATPSGAIGIAATPLAPSVMLPAWAVLGGEGSLDAIQRIQRARETGDKVAEYEARTDLLINAPMVAGPFLPRSRAAATEVPLTLSPNIVPLPAEPIQPLQPFLGARVQPGARAGFPPIEPRQAPEVPGTALEARETVIEAIRKADARTIGQIQALFPEARLSREQARAFRNIAFPPVPEPVRPQATVEEVLGKQTKEVPSAKEPQEIIYPTDDLDVRGSVPVKFSEVVRVRKTKNDAGKTVYAIWYGKNGEFVGFSANGAWELHPNFEPPPEPPPEPGGAPVPKQPITPAGGPENAPVSQRPAEEILQNVREQPVESTEALSTQKGTSGIRPSVEGKEATRQPAIPLTLLDKPPEYFTPPNLRTLSTATLRSLAKSLGTEATIPAVARKAKARFEEMAAKPAEEPKPPAEPSITAEEFPTIGPEVVAAIRRNEGDAAANTVEALHSLGIETIDTHGRPGKEFSVRLLQPWDSLPQEVRSKILRLGKVNISNAMVVDPENPLGNATVTFTKDVSRELRATPEEQAAAQRQLPAARAEEAPAPEPPAPVAEAKVQDKARTVADYWKSKSGAYRETQAGLSAGGATGKAIGGTFKEINERKAAQKSRRMESLAGKTELTPQEQTEIANAYKNLPKEVRTPPEIKPGPVAPETPAVPPQGPPEPPREFGMAAGGGFGGRRFGLDMANLWQDIKALWQRRPIKRDMAQLADAMIDTIPANKGREAGNELRVLTKERTGGKLVDNALARKAVVFVIQAKGDRAKLAADLSKVAGNKEAEASINYAQANWDALQPLANRTKSLLDAQIVYERANGIDTEYENHYVPQHHENIVTDRGVLFGETSGGPGSTGFKKAKVFPDYASAIEAGYIPRNLDIADLVEHRVRTGQRLVNRKLWADGLRTITDPFSGEPIVTDMIQRRIPRPDGTTDTQYTAPQGYVVKEIIPGVRIAVRQGYSHLFNALTGTSQIRESAVGRGALSASGWLKHQLLLLDSFHASRTMQTSLAARGKTTYNKGLSLLELSDRAITDAVNHNLITSEMASWIRTPQPFEIGGTTVHMTPREVAQLGQRNGLNVGRFADALYNDAKGLVGTNRFSRWLFEKLTRGAMVETFLSEFARVGKSNPTMDATAVARKVARDINVMFGNLQRQSVIKNPAIRDLMQIAFLAPQWVESLARRELRAVGQTAEAGLGVATGKGLHVGTVAKTVGTGLASYVALTQLINFLSRGHSTMQNEEDEHKLDAYIPDPTGQSDGFWFSPLSVFGEITHDFIRYSHTEPTAADVPQRIQENKLGPVGRSLMVLRSGEDPFGTKLPTTWLRVKEAGLQLVPLPIGVQPIMQAVGKEMGVEGMREPRPGAVVRQAAGSLGFKIEPYREGEAQMKRAREINTYIDYWIRQARQLSPENRQEYLFNQMREVGLSPQEVRKVKREIGESGVLKYR